MSYYFSGFNRCCLALVLFSFCAPANTAAFKQGDLDLLLIVGSGQAFNDNYTIVGAGVGYYVLDGLRLGVNAQTWLGGDVSINKVSPQIQYVFARGEKLKPYVGAFFRKTSIEHFDDLDSVGAKAGVYLSSQGGYYLSAGIVHENYLSCDEAVFVTCTDTYPEITFTFSL